VSEHSGISEISGRKHLITDVEAWTCVFDLPKPIILSHGEIREREYVIVRVTTSTGIQGVAYALSRGAPTGAFIRSALAPLIRGEDALCIPRIREKIEHELLLLGTDGVPERAISLLDIGLWDIKAKVAGLPLWRLLGGYRSEIPALLFDWYPTGQETADELSAEFEARVAEGYRALKIRCPGDAEWLADVLAEARHRFGRSVDLVVDAAMAWRDPQEAVAAIGLFEFLRPAWIEDPFRGDQADWLRRVREQVKVPVAAGDEVASPGAIRRLMAAEAVDVVRLDATTQGGISGFAALAHEARVRGLRICAHAYPEIHQHCAFAFPGLGCLEIFAPGTRFDSCEQFIRPSSLVRSVNGQVSAPERTGLGIDLNWAAVHAAAIDGPERSAGPSSRDHGTPAK
jgi:L-alanine-DL-glutamate epimerase-like enolase superfamily enzyme